MNKLKSMDTLSEKEKLHTAAPSRGLKTMAKIISYAFHPVLIPTFMCYVLYMLAPTSFTGITSGSFTGKILPIIINTLFFPVVATFLMKALGFIDTIFMQSSKERILPLIASMIFYFWAYRLVSNLNYPFILTVMILGSYLGVIAIFIINIFFRISMHTTAAGGMLGILLVLMFTSPVNMVLPFFLFLLIAGMVGSARLILGAHIPAEIYLGYIVGMLVQAVAYWYLV